MRAAWILVIIFSCIGLGVTTVGILWVVSKILQLILGG
jgi:hypothetical protein